MQESLASQDLPFRWLGGDPCLDFTNTVAWDADGSPLPQYERLTSYDRLVDWAREARLVDAGSARMLLERAVHESGEANAALQKGIRFRRALHDLFTGVAAGHGDVEMPLRELNRMLAHAHAHLRIVPADGEFAWRWIDAGSELTSPLWPVARSAGDLLTSGESARIRQCSGDPCGFLFLDTSRGHRRRWCDMAHCGNRAKARRHYRRVRSAG